MILVHLILLTVCQLAQILTDCRSAPVAGQKVNERLGESADLILMAEVPNDIDLLCVSECRSQPANKPVATLKDSLMQNFDLDSCQIGHQETYHSLPTTVYGC